MTRAIAHALLVLPLAFPPCLAAEEAAPPPAIKPGAVSAEITCKEKDMFSYFMYFPKAYEPARAHKWPVLFVFDPMGGNAKTLDRYIEGAERNQFVLAVSVQSSEGRKNAVEAGVAMADDVLARFPVDPQRCYASGFSSGARVAFALSSLRPKNIIGLLPSGAGSGGEKFNEKALVYGLCGAGCFSRWDMTITFQRRVRGNGQLRYFPGVHQWPDKELLAEGMDWLNAQYLLPKITGKTLIAEKTAFIKRIADEVESWKEAKPEAAYERGMLLAKSPAPEAAKTKMLLPKLANLPEVKLHLEAARNVERFAKKHYNTSLDDAEEKPVTKKMTEDGMELQAKYKDTVFGGVFKQFAQKSVAPPKKK